jgi:hypothetical protein
MNFCMSLRKVLLSEGQEALHAYSMRVQCAVSFVQHTLTCSRQMHNILSAHIRNTYDVCTWLIWTKIYCIFCSKQVVTTLAPPCRIRLRTIHWQHRLLKETRYYQLYLSRPDSYFAKIKKSYKRKPKSRHSKSKTSRHQEAYLRRLHIADAKADQLARHVSATYRMVQ